MPPADKSDAAKWAANRRLRHAYTPSPEQQALIADLCNQLGVASNAVTTRRDAAALIARLIAQRRRTRSR